MSKIRSIILSVVKEGHSQADTARIYGVSPSWVSKLVARYRDEGDIAFQPRSKRPTNSPTRIDPATIELIVGLRNQLTGQGLDAGPATIGWHLQTHHHIRVSVSSIRRHLLAAGLVTPEPKKRPKTSYVRFEADLPNEMWQTDFTHWTLQNGSTVEILTFLDDHSRYALSVTAHQRITTPIVVTEFTKTANKNGLPAAVLSDNAMVYTTRFAGGQGGRNRFGTTIAEQGVTEKHSRPNHPTTCGKVERFQQTLKKWLRTRPLTTTIAELSNLLDDFVDEYNHRRPHRSLNRTTPAAAYNRLPKTGPDPTSHDHHYRVRHDTINKSGTVTIRHNSRLHHIGIGRAHTGTPVILLIDNLDIRIIDQNTGELLRHLTLNPEIDYQPRFKTT